MPVCRAPDSPSGSAAGSAARLRFRRVPHWAALVSGAAVPSFLPAAVSTCSRCGASIHCGRDDPAGCWCARLPTLSPDRYDAAAGCLCEACLRHLLDAAAAPPRTG